MHDFDYDVMQKRRIARGAQHRKGKRGGRTCRLATDLLTQKQWKERNGQVMSYHMNEPMAWSAFKLMPIHIQVEYLQHLISRFNANSSSLATMFGVTSATVRKYIDANQIGISFKVGRSMTAEEREAWESFLGRREPNDSAPIHSETQESQVSQHGTRMRGFSLSFEGTIDAAAIANSILSIAGVGLSGRIEIICSLDSGHS